MEASKLSARIAATEAAASGITLDVAPMVVPVTRAGEELLWKGRRRSLISGLR